jgi:hypothetical protein
MYLDLSIIILAPIILSILLKNISNLNRKESSNKKENDLTGNVFLALKGKIINFFNKARTLLKNKNSKPVKVSLIINIILIASTLTYCIYKAIPNYLNEYYHEDVWARSNNDRLFEMFGHFGFTYQSYMFNPNYVRHYRYAALSHLIGLRCIDFNLIYPYYKDDLYQENTSNYNNFLNFVFNETKIIDTRNAIYKEDIFRYVKRLDYVIIDNVNNPNLCNKVLNDSDHFDIGFKWFLKDPLVSILPKLMDFGEINLIYVFKVKS